MFNFNLAKIFFSLLIVIFSFNYAESGINISQSQTNQKDCFLNDGSATDCNSGYGMGQDGDLRWGISIPNPRFVTIFCDNTGPCPDQSIDCDNNPDNDIVIDNLTALMYPKKANLLVNKDWTNALVESNNFSLCGNSEWRLPNVSELLSIINYKINNLNYYPFINMLQSYWTSTTYSKNKSEAIAINFSGSNMHGTATPLNKTNTSNVLPVSTAAMQSPVYDIPKTGQTMCYSTSGDTVDCNNDVGIGQDGDLKMGYDWNDNTRFESYNTDCIKDNLTGLIWIKEPIGASIWNLSFNDINSLNSSDFCGHNDWRLPNINELKSLINYGADNLKDWLLSKGFINETKINTLLWSSTSVIFAPAYAYVIDVPNFKIGFLDKSNLSNENTSILAVRGGNYRKSPKIYFLPLNYSFVDTFVNAETASANFAIKNQEISDNKLFIKTPVKLSGANPDDFIITNNNCLQDSATFPFRTLLPNEECQVSIKFKPTAAGNKVAFLQVEHNDDMYNNNLPQVTGKGVLQTYQLLITKFGSGEGNISVSGHITGGWDGNNGTFWAYAGNNITLTATAGANNYFKKWTGDVCNNDVSNVCNFTINGNTNVSAEFNQCTYVLSPANINYDFNANNGSVGMSAHPSCPAWTVTATSGPANWITIQGANNGTGNGIVNYTITKNLTGAARNGVISSNIGGATHFISQDPAPSYTVTVTAVANGTVTPNTNQNIYHGEVAVFTVQADAGYLPDITGSCGGTLSGNTYTTNPIISNCSINFNFSQVINGYCGTANNVLTASAPNNNLCASGNPTIVSSSADKFTWDCEGINTGTTANCMAPRGYTVTVLVNNGSLTSHTSPMLMQYGANATLSFAGLTGHYISTIEGISCGGTVYNNTDQSISNKNYNIGPITSDCSVSAIFVPKSVSFTLTKEMLDANSGGNISFSGCSVNWGGANNNVATCSTTYGASVTMTAVPDANTSEFEGWFGDGAGCGSSITCSKNITGDENIVAKFKLKNYNITTNLTGNTTGKIVKSIIPLDSIICGNGNNNCSITRKHGERLVLLFSPVSPAQVKINETTTIATPGNALTIRNVTNNLIIEINW